MNVGRRQITKALPSANYYDSFQTWFDEADIALMEMGIVLEETGSCLPSKEGSTEEFFVPMLNEEGYLVGHIYVSLYRMHSGQIEVIAYVT